ncbi:hypothetical protein WCD74_15215 [Actinomycetospora sp. OC33-EN08]|uniref:Secreted protein n=1 Tax=Actinomycetospora aurantiaca TaxID=3129233 RepID=A0ABU8MRA7_9PSEU
MTTVWIIVAVVVVLALVGGGLALARKKRSDQLQQEFGPEYDRVVAGSDSKGEAEKELAERRKRHQQLDLKPIDPQTRERFRGDWKRIQGEFVDDPGGAVEKADSLVTTIMRERGYPVDDFDQRAADISVEHPRVVENYREARRVRDAQRNGSADTEDLRSAVTSYRSLVDALLDESGDRDGDDRQAHGDRDDRDDRDDRGDRGPDAGRHRDNGRHTDDRDGPGRPGTDHDQAHEDDRSRR